ncbi:MAG: hypothetical protein UMS36scaffold28_70 [Phage 59_13]|nr:MAG: hypothetical protein UMS36scaffold28_70 [Phage 59_13]
MPRKHTYRTSGISVKGRQRTKLFPLMMNEEQREYLTRVCYKSDMNIADFIRRRAFQPGWRLILDDLRDEQKGVALDVMNPRVRSGNHNPRKPQGGADEQPNRSPVQPQ